MFVTTLHVVNRVTAMASIRKLLLQFFPSRFSAIVVDVHVTIQEHTVKYKKSNEKFQTVATWPRQSPVTDYDTRRQHVESPLENSTKSQSNCLN